MSAWTDLEQPQSPYHLRQQLEQHRYATLFLQLEEPKDDDLEYNCFYESSSVDVNEAGVTDAVQDSSIGNSDHNHTSAVISRYNGRLHEDFLGEKMLSLLTELNFSSNNPINLHSIRKHYLQHGGYLDFQDEMLVSRVLPWIIS